MRTFWKYFLIILLLVLGLFSAAVLYLFFVPGAKLFGIQYISLNEHYTSEGYATDGINTISVNARDYEIIVRQSDTDTIYLFVNSQNTGFVKTEHSTLDVEISKTNGHLTFNVSEPYGATIISDSRVILCVPKINEYINLNISNKSGTTTIQNELLFNDFSYKTESGNMTISDATIAGQIKLDTNHGNVVVNENVTLSGNNLSIKANSSQFDFSKHDLGEIEITKNNNCVLLVKSAARITGDFDNAGGRIEAGTVDHFGLNSSDTNVYIKKLKHGGGIFLTKGGKVNIEEVLTPLTVETVNGNITIGKSTSNLSLSSRHGDITVTAAMKKVTATNNYGAINVTFDQTAESNYANSDARKLIATNNNGKITCVGADNVTITATDNARVDLTMHDIVGVNTINGANGAIEVVVPAYKPNSTDVKLPFVLSFKSDRNVLVNLAQLDITGVSESAEPIYVNCTEANGNSLAINTKGLLTVLDTITTEL